MALVDRNGLVEPIRFAQRELVRELGFMRPSLAETVYSPACVHSLVEIGSRNSSTLDELSLTLRLDPKRTGEVLQTLLDAAEIECHNETGKDGKTFTLTSKGRQTLRSIDAFATSQVLQAIGNVPPQDAKSILAGLQAYATALNARSGSVKTQPPLAAAVEIVSGYHPGIVGRAVEMHGTFYAKLVGFGSVFETRIASDLASIISRLDHKGNQAWAALLDGRVVGTVFIDGQSLEGNKAHLRSFIVDDGIRGGGVGRRLLKEAVDFSDAQGFEEIHLWTFRGLDAARRLYESFGFTLESESMGDMWGGEVSEQVFVRKRGSGGILS